MISGTEPTGERRTPSARVLWRAAVLTAALAALLFLSGVWTLFPIESPGTTVLHWGAMSVALFTCAYVGPAIAIRGTDGRSAWRSTVVARCALGLLPALWLANWLAVHTWYMLGPLAVFLVGAGCVRLLVPRDLGGVRAAAAPDPSFAHRLPMGLAALVLAGVYCGSTRYDLQPPYPGHWATDVERASWGHRVYPWLLRDIGDALPVWLPSWRQGDGLPTITPEGPGTAEADGFDVMGGQLPVRVRIGDAEWHGIITFERSIQPTSRVGPGPYRDTHRTQVAGILDGPTGRLRVRPVAFLDQDLFSNLGRRMVVFPHAPDPGD